MAKYTVEAESLKAIADGIRSWSGMEEELKFPNDFLTGVANSYIKGKQAGLDEGAAICATKHFVCNFKGSGTGSVSFYVPFEPDALCITGFDPTFSKKPYALGSFVADLRAFGQAAGNTAYGNASSGAMTNAAFTTTSVLNRYSRTEDGTVTIQNISSSVAVVFDASYTYTAVAVKYAEQTDKERITDFVNGLTGSGTVTLNQAKVSAAFTDDEWAALITTKPNWTFNWI